MEKLKLITSSAIVLALALFVFAYGNFWCNFKNQCQSIDNAINVVAALIVLISGGLFIKAYSKSLKQKKPIFSNSRRAEKTLLLVTYITAVILVIIFLAGNAAGN